MKNGQHKSRLYSRPRYGTSLLLNELFALRERLDKLIYMCGAASASPQSIQPGSPLQTPCTEHSEIEPLSTLELSEEEGNMLAKVVSERRYQNGSTHLHTALEHR